MDIQKTLDSLRAAAPDVQWAFDHWDVPPPVPYGVIYDDGKHVLYADNRAYLTTGTTGRVELCDAVPNFAAEKAVETWLDANFPVWHRESRQSETLPDEQSARYITIYEFEVIPHAASNPDQ